MLKNQSELKNTIWGETQECFPILSNVYHVHGETDSGLVVSMDYAHLVFSDKALAFAEVHNGYAYFPWHTTGRAARYEVLRHMLKSTTDLDEQAFLRHQILELVQLGHADFPEYFGECPPPSETHESLVEDFQKIANGIYVVLSGGHLQLAVDCAIAETKLSDVAQMLSCKAGNYLFFDEFASAAPLFELYNNFKSEYKAIFDSFGLTWDCVHAALHQNFRSYIIVAEEDGISVPVTDAAVKPFLHLDSCSQKTA